VKREARNREFRKIKLLDALRLLEERNLGISGFPLEFTLNLIGVWDDSISEIF
jgi:hypothetical protein